MTSRILGGVGRSLVVVGLFTLGFVAFQLWGTGLEESRNQDDLAENLATTTQSADSYDGADLDALTEQLATVDPTTAPPTAPPAEGEAVGVIEIPRIGLQRVIVEGVDRADLKKGPGHYPTSPLPGQPGNAAIAGHRTTYGAPFNRIDELQPGDAIIVTTPQGRFHYQVRSSPDRADQAWWSVKPTEVSVLDDTGANLLTLTACHPKYSARERIIVQAELTTEPAAATPPPPSTAASRAAAGEDLDEGMGGVASALPWAVAFAAAALVIGVVAWAIGRRWRRWPVYLIAAPVILVLVWGSYVHLDRYLPAI